MVAVGGKPNWYVTEELLTAETFVVGKSTKVRRAVIVKIIMNLLVEFARMLGYIYKMVKNGVNSTGSIFSYCKMQNVINTYRTVIFRKLKLHHILQFK